MTVAVVIPCYKVTAHVLTVIRGIGEEVDYIFAVDDCCPDGSADLIERDCNDERVRVIRHSTNLGVGGAMVTGYRAALSVGADIVVKVDGDGQMNPALIPEFLEPITRGDADYAKGNRFHSLYGVRKMPWRRALGNALLGFATKMSSGYWSVFDPTNGYTAIHADALRALDLDHLSLRYFFESDMLIKLGDVRAVVADVPMEAVYADERSNLRIRNVAWDFISRHPRAFLRRIVYSYFLRDFNLASINLVVGLLLLVFGTVYGALHWWQSATTGVLASTGVVMIAVLPIVLGFQMLLFFVGFDIGNEPKRPLRRRSLSSFVSRRGPRVNEKQSTTPAGKSDSH
jgi:glycosyltransferase involved in cell wall biosynthesis